MEIKKENEVVEEEKEVRKLPTPTNNDFSNEQISDKTTESEDKNTEKVKSKHKDPSEKLFARSSDKSPFIEICYKLKDAFKFLVTSGIIFIFVIIFADQLSKQLFQRYLQVESFSVTLIPHVLDVTLVYNTGAAWGMMSGNRFFLIAMPLVLGGIMIAFYAIMFRKLNKVVRAALTMMIGGCYGNFIDRAFYPDGKVIDFIDFSPLLDPILKNTPVFNFADAFLVVGIGVLIIGEIIVLIKEHISDKRKISEIEESQAIVFNENAGKKDGTSSESEEETGLSGAKLDLKPKKKFYTPKAFTETTQIDISTLIDDCPIDKSIKIEKVSKKSRFNRYNIKKTTTKNKTYSPKKSDEEVKNEVESYTLITKEDENESK